MENNVIARSTDPETSHEAAASISEDKQQMSIRTVVKLLRDRGPMTDFQISEHWHLYYPKKAWSESLPRKARGWARDAGLVRRVGHGTHNGHRVGMWACGKEDNLPAKRAAKPACVSPTEYAAVTRVLQLEKELAQARQDLSTANEEVDAIHKCADATEEQLREALALLKGAEERITALSEEIEEENAKRKEMKLDIACLIADKTALLARVEEKQLMWEEAGRCLCEVISQRDELAPKAAAICEVEQAVAEFDNARAKATGPFALTRGQHADYLIFALRKILEQ